MPLHSAHGKNQAGLASRLSVPCWREKLLPGHALFKLRGRRVSIVRRAGFRYKTGMRPFTLCCTAAGFSLIELIITLALMIILSAML